MSQIMGTTGTAGSTEQRASAGTMTAAMAVRSNVAVKVLRVAIVRSGAIVEERVMRERATVTCGTNEACAFVVGGRAPERHELFVADGARYVAALREGMSGRVALATGVCEVATIISQGVRRLDLDDSARGKIVVGDTSFLFQLVDAPIEARPKLPLAMRRHLGVDWNLTVIAAMSFLVHFGIVGASYSDFADPVHDEDSIVSVVDTIQSLPTPMDVQTTPAIDSTPTASDPSTSSPTPTPRAQPAPGPHAQPPRAPGVSASELEQARAAFLLAYGNGQRVAVLDPTAPMLPPGVWVERPANGRDPNAPVTMIDAPIAPGSPAPVPTTSVYYDPPHVVVTRPALPPVIVNPGPPVGPVDPAPVSGLSGRARYCYQQALLKNPNQAGRVVIAIKVGPSGDVVGSSVLSSNGLDASVGQCILGGAANLHFKSPGPGGGQLNVPFTFIKQ
jgi:hypothetical protein